MNHEVITHSANWSFLLRTELLRYTAHRLTVSRLRGTHLGTLSDFVRLLSTKNGSLEKQKI